MFINVPSMGNLVGVGTETREEDVQVSDVQVREGRGGQCTSRRLHNLQCKLHSPHGLVLRGRGQQGGLRTRYCQQPRSLCGERWGPSGNCPAHPPPVWPVSSGQAFCTRAGSDPPGLRGPRPR